MPDNVDEIVGFEEPSDDTDRLAYAVIGAAIDVHRALGAGHAEVVYRNALCVELRHRGIPYQTEFPYTVTYRNEIVGQGRLDLLVGGVLVVELKAVEAIAPVHVAQLIGYLKAIDASLGLLINFNAKQLKDGIRRVALTHK
jgi:GxxExxY protein